MVIRDVPEHDILFREDKYVYRTGCGCAVPEFFIE